MENITLGQIAVTLTFIVGIIGAIGYLRTHLKAWVASALKDELTTINKKIDCLSEKIESVDQASCKNFLVARLAEIECGQYWDEIERQRFYEQYEHYINHGGNSYIKAKVEKLQKDGRI